MDALIGSVGLWLTHAVQSVYNWVWSPALVVLCLVAGFYFSFRTRLVQVRRFGEMFRLLFAGTGKDKKKTGISSFQAFAMALSGRVGTGNIVGVATAIGFGGPGAIVWMWIIAFFGAGSAFVEATLAQIYKEDHNGQFRGGPAYYIEKGLRSPFFGGLFAVLAAVACGVFLPPVQCNGIALSCARSFGVAPWVVGAVVAVLIATVIIGGVKRIASVAQIVAPFMAMIYIVLAIVVWTVGIGYLLTTIDLGSDFFKNRTLEVIVCYLDACASAVGIANGLFILFRFREQWIAWYICAALEAVINILAGQFVLLVLKLGYFTNTTYGYIKWSHYIKRAEQNKVVDKSIF